MKPDLVLAFLMALTAGCGTMGYPESANQRFNRYMAAYPDTPVDVQQKIRAGTIAVGMTKGQVIAAWGQPRMNNDSSDGFDQWVYGDPAYNATYLYFRNGVLDKFQRSR